METRPDMKKYKSLASATIIEVLAVIILIAGIISIIVGIANSSEKILGMSAFIFGFSCILSWAMLSIIAHIADDIHYQNYLKEYYGEEAANYHKASLQKLQSIERMMLLQNPPPQEPYYPPQGSYYPPQDPVPPAPVPQPEYDEPAPVPQPRQPAPDYPPRKQARFSITAKEKKPFRRPGDTTPDEYQAQFRRPEVMEQEEPEGKPSEA